MLLDKIRSVHNSIVNFSYCVTWRRTCDSQVLPRKSDNFLSQKSSRNSTKSILDFKTPG
jgi:hypothetical protein